MGQSPQLNRIFSPLVYIVYPIPKIVFVPVLLLIFGIGDLSKIINIFLVLFFPRCSCPCAKKRRASGPN